MLGKLIKHEFRATGRVMLPLLAAVLILSPLAGVSILSFDRKSFGSAMQIVSSVVLVAFAVSVIAICITSFIIMIRRFYTSLLCDEGYLTFTLPAGTAEIILSKLIVSFVWFVAALLSCLAGFVIIAVISWSDMDFSEVKSYIREIKVLAGTGNLVCYCLEALVCAFLYSCMCCLHFYAAMALGHSFSDHRIFLSVCFYIILSIVMFALTVLFINIAGKSGWAWLNTFKETVSNPRDLAVIPHTFFAAAAAYLLAASAILFVPTVLPLKKRLNLN